MTHPNASSADDVSSILPRIAHIHKVVDDGVDSEVHIQQGWSGNYVHFTALMAVTANRDRQATKITSVHGSHLRVGEVVGNLEHLDRGHDVEVHDGLGKARDVPQLCNPQHSGPKDSKSL